MKTAGVSKSLTRSGELFGAKSERRLFDPNGRQLSLGELFRAEKAAAQEIEVAGHRRRAVAREKNTEEEALRFDPSVPVEEIVLANPEMEGQNPDDYELVGEKVTCRLAQRPGSYVVLRYVRKVYKRRGTASSPVPRLRRRCWRRAARTSASWPGS